MKNGFCVLAIVAVVALAASGCGHARIASTASENGVGSFNAEASSALPFTIDPGEKWVQFGEGAEAIERAKAYAAYATAANATAVGHATGRGITNERRKIARALRALIKILPPQTSQPKERGGTGGAP